LVTADEWVKTSVGLVAEVKGGKRLPQGTPWSENQTDHPYIRATDIQNGRVCVENLVYVPDSVWPIISRFVVASGDILITIAGTIGSIGKVPVSHSGANLTENAALIRPNQRLVIPEFLLEYLLQKSVQLEIDSLTIGTTQKKLGLSRIESLQIKLPSLIEQQKIAEALSDVMEAIESLDALIAKKRDVKQATMQQLLAGRTRLPGFTADWNELELSKVAEIGPGINKALSEMGSGSLYVTVEDIYHGSFLDAGRLGRIRISKSEVERFSLQVGDLVLGKSSVKRDGIGYPNLFLGCAEPVVPSGFTYRVRPDKKVLNSAFLLQYLRSRPGRKWIIDNSQSSALTNINSSIVNRYPVIMPPLKEQEAIAEALTVMDDELGALTEQAFKLRMVKQGMMQDLLTGKVRLM
jgi:type I restriction enzyme S subunit